MGPEASGPDAAPPRPPAPPPPGWNFDEEARRNPFFAQVWTPNHDPEENNVYPEDCWKDIVEEKPPSGG